MVDRVVQRTNTSILVDNIEFLTKPHAQNSDFYRNLYLTEGLSAAQIGERIGCSKTAVLQQLREQGIRNGSGRRTDPENYKLYDPPYGFSKKNGRLVPNKAEMRVCRIVVNLRDSQGKSMRAIGKHLEELGLKNRKGLVSWTHGTVGRIFERWQGKI